MSSQLHLARGLSFPVEFVTETAAILAKRGVGKTHTAVVLTEEMLAAGQQVVVLDPLDVWYGLRSSADGRAPGFSITVLGGEHGDLPLEAGAGAVVAEFVVEHAMPVILSMRHFSMSEQRRFVTDFCERLYQLKGQGTHRTPMHLVIDEADEFVPQRIQAGQERMFGSIDRLVRRGRASGVGVTLISQRAAVVNKDVLTQVEVLICLRTISPQDRKALEAWIEAHDAHDQRAEFIVSLASLAIGEAWIWSPGWLDVFKRVQIRGRKTFDSSATPKVGQPRPDAPTAAAVVDLAALRAQLSTTIERARSEDPRELRRELAALKQKLYARPAEAPAGAPDSTAAVEEARAAGYADGWKAAVAAGKVRIVEMGRSLDDLRAGAEKVLAMVRDKTVALPASPSAVAAVKAPERISVRLAAPRTIRLEPTIARAFAGLGGGEQRVLSILAQHSTRTKVQLAIMAGYSSNGGGFSNILSRLRSLGYAEGREPIRITPGGLLAVGTVTPLPEGPGLFAEWCQKLGKAERLILEELRRVFPSDRSREEIAAATGYEASGGGFSNAVSRLRTLELVTTSSGRLRLAEELTDGGAA